MFNSMFDKGMLPVLEAGLNFTTARHQAILQNLANVDTPFYKAVDAPVAEFQQLLKRSIQHRDERPVPIFRLEQGLDVKGKPEGGLAVRFRENKDEGPLGHNDNNTNIEMEMVRMADNTAMHNALAELLQQQFKMLGEAIRARGAAA